MVQTIMSLCFTKKDSGYKQFQTTGKNSTTIKGSMEKQPKSGKRITYVVAQKKVNDKYMSDRKCYKTLVFDLLKTENIRKQE